jgi:DNA invertase Pin-like site-specific DNA recombinase
MCKKCICLCRVSTNAQDLEGQREKVVANAIADGYTMDEIAVVEKKESAIKLSEMERESLNEMKEIINDNPTIESVYVFAIDRLARRVSIVLSIKDYLTERGINLVFLNPHKMGTLRKDNGKMVEDELTSMLLMFLSYGAEMEMKIKKERFAAAKAVMQKQKKLTSGKPVFGYKKNADGTISVNEEEAAIVRQIYYEVLHNDKPIKQIEREMIAKGFIKPKKTVTGSSVRYYCANKAYYGSTSTYGSIMSYPPIITKEEFDAMQVKMAENRKTAKKNTKQTHLCKGLIRNMDSNLIMIYNSSSHSYVDSYNHSNINAVTMDFLAWYIGKALYTFYLGVVNNKTAEQYKEFIKENNTKIDNIKSMINNIELRQRKAFKMYLDGKVTDDIYNEEINKIKAELNTWNSELAKLESDNKRMELETAETENKKEWNSNSLNDITDLKVRKEIINTVINEIQVTKIANREYEIYFIAKDSVVQKMYGLLTQKFIYKTSGHKITLLDSSYKGSRVIDISSYIKSGETPTFIYNE